MSDSVITVGPESDKCALCGVTRSDHSRMATATGHHFVVKAQLASSRPQPRDPFRDIRPMTDEDKQRETTVERTFADAKTPARVKEERTMEKFKEPEDLTPQINDRRPCEVCSKPRSSHRGSVDHKYSPMSEAAIAAREKLVQAGAAREQLAHTVAARAAKRRSAPSKPAAGAKPSFLELAGEIDALRSQLEAKVALMKEMLG